MSFASPVFLWYFMPALLLAYWASPRTWRNGLIAVSSLLFYSWGAGPFVFLLVSAMVVNFAAGIAIDSPSVQAKPWLRRTVLVGAVGWNLAILATWKYAGFASRQIDAISTALGLDGTPIVQLALPIGISFFTFHHISYIVDVYRHSRPAQRSPLQFIVYIGMFPQLIAGPIVRYHEIADQLGEVRKDRADDFAAGFPRFALGLAKKVIIADSVAPVADAAFASGADLTTATAWVGALAYTVQIYFDFSGYSDMAIGLARMFGFRLPENFDRPYSAATITDFWRRWHMSLSRWFRDYVYIPLGGNRGGNLKTYRNLVTIFVLCGFWHGANWTFLAWGLYHGSLLVAERLTGLDRVRTGIALVGQRAATLLLVVVGWVFFRSESIADAGRMLRYMFVPSGFDLTDAVAVELTSQRELTLLLALLVVLLPASFVLGRYLETARSRVGATARVAVMAVAAPYAAILVAAGTFSPFLYYQF
jgi:alginate O-acetyltransferase complex protein AlgI